MDGEAMTKILTMRQRRPNERLRDRVQAAARRRFGTGHDSPYHSVGDNKTGRRDPHFEFLRLRRPFTLLIWRIPPLQEIAHERRSLRYRYGLPFTPTSDFWLIQNTMDTDNQ
jgi:hypothetical protein